MPQINLHVTPEFEEALEALVRGKGLASKSQAIRYAVQEATAPYLAAPRRDFSVLKVLHPKRSGGTRGTRISRRSENCCVGTAACRRARATSAPDPHLVRDQRNLFLLRKAPFEGPHVLEAHQLR
jgi:hypothetical protein